MNYFKKVSGDIFRYRIFDGEVGDQYKLEFKGSIFDKAVARPCTEAETEAETALTFDEIDEETYMEECGTPIAQYAERIGARPVRPS